VTIDIERRADPRERVDERRDGDAQRDRRAHRGSRRTQSRCRSGYRQGRCIFRGQLAVA
jgi:hypothetical protein